MTQVINLSRPTYLADHDLQAFHERIATVEDSSCWEWIGGRAAKGYGGFYWAGRWMPAHRFSYWLYKGPALGKVIDHLCRNRNCVNPDHLDSVKNRRNLERGRVDQKRLAFLRLIGSA